jgi:hypothetical protein
MKKIYLIAGFSLLMAIGAKAQTATPQTGTTNVHVELQDVLAIAVNNADVNLRFLQASDYTTGITTAQPSHLTVTSNKPYTLNVSAAGNLSGVVAGNADILEPGVIAISLPTTGNNTNLGAVPTPVTALTTINAPLVTNATAAASKPIDVLYAVPASVSTTNKILGKKADTYTTVVTYTISQ